MADCGGLWRIVADCGGLLYTCHVLVLRVEGRRFKVLVLRVEGLRFWF